MNMGIDSEPVSEPRKRYGWTTLGIRSDTKNFIDSLMTKDMTYDECIRYGIGIYLWLKSNPDIPVPPIRLRASFTDFVVHGKYVLDHYQNHVHNNKKTV